MKNKKPLGFLENIKKIFFIVALCASANKIKDCARQKDFKF